MKVKNIKKLIDALESGEYKKSKLVLHSNYKSLVPLIVVGQDFPVKACDAKTRHCCLGVAECLMPASKRQDAKTGIKFTETPVRTKRYKAIGEWLGLKPMQMQTLIDINDATRTFKPVIKALKQAIGDE